MNSDLGTELFTNSKLTKKSNIDFRIVLEIEHKELVWTGSFNRSSLSCTKETITENGEKILSVEDAVYSYHSIKHEIVFEYQGSILSRLKENPHAHILKVVKEKILNIRSLDLISPELLRSRNRSAEGKLGLGGEKLSAFVRLFKLAMASIEFNDIKNEKTIDILFE